MTVVDKCIGEIVNKSGDIVNKLESLRGCDALPHAIKNEILDLKNATAYFLNNLIDDLCLVNQKFLNSCIEDGYTKNGCVKDVLFENLIKTIRNDISHLLQCGGMNLTQIGAKSGVRYNFISNILNNKIDYVNLARFKTVAVAICALDWSFYIIDYQNNEVVFDSNKSKTTMSGINDFGSSVNICVNLEILMSKTIIERNVTITDMAKSGVSIYTLNKFVNTSLRAGVITWDFTVKMVKFFGWYILITKPDGSVILTTNNQ